MRSFLFVIDFAFPDIISNKNCNTLSNTDFHFQDIQK